MKKVYLIFFLFLFAFADENINNFLKTLNEVSEIATKTKLNIDKTPSNVSILNRDFIKKSGARTLLDLLQYIPGVEISISASGKKQLIIRGNKSTFRDKIKFLINGHEVTNNLYSNQFYYYNFPASLIKRIEFTKTPDAVLYGDKAFLGVINIITLNKLDNNYISFYQNNKHQNSFVLFQKFKHSLIDFHYEYSNPNLDNINTTLIDIQKFSAIPYRNASPNPYEQNIGFGYRFYKNNSSLTYRIEYYKKGNFFGLDNLPSFSKDKHIKFIHQFINYNYSKFINDFAKNSFNIGIKHYTWKDEFRAFPYDFNETIDNNPNNDIIVGAQINEIEYYLNDNITYNTEKHIINLIFNAKYAKPYDFYYLQYIPSFNNKYKITGENNVLKKGIERKIYAIAAEDLYTLNDNIAFVYGARYSHYNDFGSNISYKLGSVYNMNEKTTFKLLYNTAFRAPSWVELYAKSASTFNGNPDLKPEKIKMTEFIWLQKIFENDKLKFVVYHGKERNYIGREYSASGKKIYKNLGNYLIRGYEISYKKVFSKGIFDLSYSKNDNKALFSDILGGLNRFNYSGIRKNFYKGYLIYNINRSLNIFSSVFYGDKINIPVVNDIPHYFSLNGNINYHKKGYSFILGINNITNHKNYYVDYPSDLIYGRYFFVSNDGRLSSIGRNVYVEISKEW